MRGGRKIDRHTLTEGDRGGAGWGGERERMNYFYLFFFWICENVYKPEM